MSSDWIKEIKENDKGAESQESARLQKVVEDSMIVASGEKRILFALGGSVGERRRPDGRNRAERASDQAGQC